MKEFSQTEIVQSLKNDSIHMLIMSGIFMENIDTIKQELEDDRRTELATRIKSRLNDQGNNTLELANIFEENGDLSDLGLAHVYSFLKNNGVEGIKINPKKKEESHEDNIEDKIRENTHNQYLNKETITKEDSQNILQKKWWEFWK